MRNFEFPPLKIFSLYSPPLSSREAESATSRRIASSLNVNPPRKTKRRNDLNAAFRKSLRFCLLPSPLMGTTMTCHLWGTWFLAANSGNEIIRSQGGSILSLISRFRIHDTSTMIRCLNREFLNFN